MTHARRLLECDRHHNVRRLEDTVGRVWHTDHNQVHAVVVQTPQAAMIAARVQVPDVQTLGQMDPGRKVTLVGHVNEQQMRIARIGLRFQ